jgi:hypothetical protein
MKYARYAIGEIVLVVVGILIALSINNWNQNRISNNEEQTTLLNIHTEFLQNKESLKASIVSNEIGFNSSKVIFNLIGKQRIQINKHNLDSLFFNVFESGSFTPSENTISDLLQSGSLQLLKNKKLKNLIHQWSRILKSYENTQNRVELKIDEQLIPYLSRKYSLKDIDNYGQLNWKNKTSLSVDKLQVFEDIEFENILDDYLYRKKSSKKGLLELEKIIDDILKETETKNDKIL